MTLEKNISIVQHRNLEVDRVTVALCKNSGIQHSCRWFILLREFGSIRDRGKYYVFNLDKQNSFPYTILLNGIVHEVVSIRPPA